MTGTVSTKPAKNNAEWARNTEKRLNAAENPTAVRAGDWVLSTDTDNGNLIAGYANGGSVIVATAPNAADNPDQVTGNVQPFIKVERQANQSGTRGTTSLVLWDSLAFQTDGWGFVPTATDIVVPKSGVYTIKYHLAFLNASSALNKGVLLIDAVVRMAQERPGGGSYVSHYMAEDFALNAGSIISCGAYVDGSGTFDFGSSGADTSVHTSLSLLKLEVD